MVVCAVREQGGKGWRGRCRGVMTAMGRGHFADQVETWGMATALSRVPGPGWVCSHWGLMVALLSPGP